MTHISLLISLFGKRLQVLFLSGSLILSASVFLVIVSGVFFTRKNVELRTKDLYFDDLPEQLDGLRIVQISDIHLGTFGHDESVVKKSLSTVQSVKPDLLLFTGDIVNNFADEFMGYESYLSDFQAKYGKFAILGNHDYGDYYQWPDSLLKKSNLAQIKTNIEKCGFQLLLNQSKNIQIKDTSLTLIGVENWGHKPFPQYADLKSAMKNIPEKSFKILMSHDPAHWEAVVVPQTNIPLTLSGHTHGGQFALKIAGIEFSPIYFVQKYWGGLYKNDNQFLYVNRGLGTIGFAGRIESNPEVTLLILHRTRIH
jgi:predicted MPP superfamily phosphohydrolase